VPPLLLRPVGCDRGDLGVDQWSYRGMLRRRCDPDAVPHVRAVDERPEGLLESEDDVRVVKRVDVPAVTTQV
jgi:hypothetical protein